jgi:DNA-directed RNA polymerase specialized sigma24 family protein
MARPIKPIDEEQLRKCAEKQWTIEEIAAFFRVSRDTIERRYAAIYKEARQSGRAKLRDLQWARALNGSDTMLKHMSEHYLDQTPRTKISIEDAWDALPAEQKAILIKKDLDGSGK